MVSGYAYIWEPSAAEFTGGCVRAGMVELTHLHYAPDRQTELRGRYVDVINFGEIVGRTAPTSKINQLKISNARPDKFGNFIFEPCAGGIFGGEGGILSAARFAEVNAYYYITTMAECVDNVLCWLGEKPLPKIRAVVNAHVPGQLGTSGSPHASADQSLKPVSGVAYHFPTNVGGDRDGALIACHGALLFGPGSTLTQEGWLARISGGTYLCNPAHIAGFIYQGYGRHVVRHTADLWAEAFRAPSGELKQASALETALTSFMAAEMLSTPYIWCWHRRHDAEYSDPENLAHNLCISKTEAFMARQDAFAARVLAGCLWDLHKQLSAEGISCLKLVVAALHELGRLTDNPFKTNALQTHHLRSSAESFASCLIHAARVRFDTRCERAVRKALANRGLNFRPLVLSQLAAPSVPKIAGRFIESNEIQYHIDRIKSRFEGAIVPKDKDFVHPDELARFISTSAYDLSAVGDVMPGMRMRHRIRRFGKDYPFAWVRPVLSRSALVTGNLEGPFARVSERAETTRNFSYKVNPRLASVLRRAGFNAMTIANNHIQDCGRSGVIETIETLEKHHIRPYGGGRDEKSAHIPAILDGVRVRIGLLGYYWNNRCAARGELAGSARDLPQLIERDMAKLRPLVDRIVVMVHWGVPYERQPLDEDRRKAHHFIDLGADAVIGHHPHILQPIEIYKKRPIFYSVGNFAFGSGNSKAESVLTAFRFNLTGIEVDIFPVYVQNRDPRLNYQPKVIGGASGRSTIERLLSMSPDLGCTVAVHDYCLRLSISEAM
jgi:poly-gamma-glutamate capsule biosynthesis protein CapA/YwtB (metallophosphatase superfamily)